jgi:methylated-DNA-[protein]-cysteine S-methyltransferase
MDDTATERADRPTHFTYIDSPVGPLLAVERDGLLRGLHFTDDDGPFPEDGWVADDVPFVDLRRQLEEYFAGARRRFDLPLGPGGTEFQQQVWSALRRIPYGATSSYAAVAAAVGRPRAVRAVGGANGANRIPIVIPCHRVVGADGSLTGFGGGLWRKEVLLGLEQDVLAGAAEPSTG